MCRGAAPLTRAFRESESSSDLCVLRGLAKLPAKQVAIDYETLEIIVEQGRVYWQHAEECAAIGAKMNNVDLRIQVLALADRWDRLEVEREKLLPMGAKLRSNS